MLSLRTAITMMIVCYLIIVGVTVLDIPLPSQPPSQLIDLSEVPLPPEVPPLPPCPPVTDGNLVRLVAVYSFLCSIADFECKQYRNVLYTLCLRKKHPQHF